MIDLHCHILPGLDDGPDTVDEAIKIAKAAVKEGVTTVVATPHCYNGVYTSPAGVIDEACRLLNEHLVARKVPLVVLPGSEIRITNDTVQLWDENLLVGLNGNRHVLLLELPNLFILEGINLLIRRLVDKGVQPIIAHPERNPVILKQPEVATALKYHGARLQVTAGSLVGDFGKYAQEMAEHLCGSGLADFVSSDVHPERKYRMEKAFRVLKKMLGSAAACQILVDNPASALAAGYTAQNVCNNSAVV